MSVFTGAGVARVVDVKEAIEALDLPMGGEFVELELRVYPGGWELVSDHMGPIAAPSAPCERGGWLWSGDDKEEAMNAASWMIHSRE